MRFAAATPDRVERLVLVNPALPAPLSTWERMGWQTLGRLAVAVGPALARGLARLWGRTAIDRKLAFLEQSVPAWPDTMGGDPSRISADNIVLWTEQFADLRSHPEKMGYAVTGFASAVPGIFVDGSRALKAIDRIGAPTLLLWGEQDPLIVRPMIDHVLARRPDWHLHVFASAGHTAPLEVPDEYAGAVARWLAEAHPTRDTPAG